MNEAVTRARAGRAWPRRAVQVVGMILMLAGLALPWVLGQGRCVTFAADEP